MVSGKVRKRNQEDTAPSPDFNFASIFFSLSCNQDIIYIFISSDRFVSASVCDFGGMVYIAKITKGLLYKSRTQIAAFKPHLPLFPCFPSCPVAVISVEGSPQGKNYPSALTEMCAIWSCLQSFEGRLACHAFAL